LEREKAIGDAETKELRGWLTLDGPLERREGALDLASPVVGRVESVAVLIDELITRLSEGERLK
jgi:hypothetical protein